MARPRSEDRRRAILAAATELVAQQGVGAATAEIAKRAAVPHGSVFTYFPTKEELLNTLYRELTTELTNAVLAEMPTGADTRARFHHLWVRWTAWGVANDAKRRAQAQLNVSDQVTDRVRDAAYEYAEPVFQLIRQVSARGVLRDAPIRYVGSLVDAWATTTMNFMSRNATKADELCELGFKSVVKALT